MTIEEKFKHWRDWSNTVLGANCVNVFGIWFRDVYPYKSSQQPKENLKKCHKTGIVKDMNLSRPLIGQAEWEIYKPENINGKQVHNIQILRNTYQPQITFDQYLARFN